VAEISDDPSVHLAPRGDAAALATAIDRALSERRTPDLANARFPDWSEAAEKMLDVLFAERPSSKELRYQLEECA
jgi:hypothetical protein